MEIDHRYNVNNRIINALMFLEKYIWFLFIFFFVLNLLLKYLSQSIKSSSHASISYLIIYKRAFLQTRFLNCILKLFYVRNVIPPSSLFIRKIQFWFKKGLLYIVRNLMDFCRRFWPFTWKRDGFFLNKKVRGISFFCHLPEEN